MAVLGGLTTLAIIFSIVVSVRKDTLVGKREADEAAATSRTIQGQSEQVAGLKRQLSEAEENLAELTSQRTLTKEQKERIAAALKKSPPQELTIIRTSDLETQAFAEEIAKVIGDGNWKVLPTPFRFITHAEPGLRIMVRDINVAPAGATILQNALKQAGLSADGVSSNEVEDGKFVLWVGPKKVTRN